MVLTTLPRLLSKILPTLYELRSFVRAAFTNIGRVLKTKMAVETAPASTGRLASMTVSKVPTPPERGVLVIEQPPWHLRLPTSHGGWLRSPASARDVGAR